MSPKKRIGSLLAARKLWQVLFAVSVLAIVYLATTSQTYTVQATFNDKFNHIIAFAELTVLARLGWPQARLLISMMVVMGFGLMIELVQAPMPHRYFSVMDLLADAVGMALGLLIAPGLRSVVYRWAPSGNI